MASVINNLNPFSSTTYSYESFARCMQNHPTATKVIKVAALVLGTCVLASLPFSAPFLSAGVIAGLAVSASVLCLTSLTLHISSFVLDILYPPHHDMKNHMYSEATCEAGKLFYDGDVPILTLESDDPYVAGKAHGYLCGSAINDLTRRFDFALHFIARKPRASELEETINTFKSIIPDELLLEMKGIVDGYNEWVKEQSIFTLAKVITLEDAILFHLIPDSLHFDPSHAEKRLKLFQKAQDVEEVKDPLVACSAIVDKEDDRFVFARNMDWPSFGLSGTYSLVINRVYTQDSGKRNTIEVSTPGIVGTFTGMNDKGLSLAMNVCQGQTEDINGMPACIYNRVCLESFSKVEEVEEFTRSNKPLGSYHLTVVDDTEAKSFHFDQSNKDLDDKTVIREWAEDEPLVTLNCRYSPKPNQHMHYSQKRQQELDSFFKDRQDRALDESISLPYVNNDITTHSVVMIPETKTFKVAFDNAYAGDNPLLEIDTDPLLNHS